MWCDLKWAPAVLKANEIHFTSKTKKPDALWLEVLNMETCTEKLKNLTGCLNFLFSTALTWFLGFYVCLALHSYSSEHYSLINKAAQNRILLPS